jgi:hypothetical protein
VASAEPAGGLTRRALLAGAGLALGALALLPRRLRAADAKFQVGQTTLDALAKAKLVHVSPLKADGHESRCHAEVWYFWDTDAVVIGTATSGWKVRAPKGGKDKARIWVGDYGSSAPTFLAKATIDADPATFDRLLASYAVRYADEWGKWKPRFESSYKDGSRTVVRYTPIGA